MRLSDCHITINYGAFVQRYASSKDETKKCQFNQILLLFPKDMLETFSKNGSSGQWLQCIPQSLTLKDSAVSPHSALIDIQRVSSDYFPEQY
jgi:hypothetical protein